MTHLAIFYVTFLVAAPFLVVFFAELVARVQGWLEVIFTDDRRVNDER